MKNHTATEPPPNAPAVGAQVKRRVRPLAALLACLILTACDAAKPTPAARADARIALFKECMQLAAKLERKADDDVSDVVSQCSNQAYYMTNHIQ